MKLSVLKSNALVSEVDLGKEVEGVSSALTFYVGRSDTCHVVLDDPQISREHAELTFSAGTWTIRKISELSLMLINGIVTSQGTLSSGDILSIGPFAVTVFIPPAIVSQPVMSETAVESPVDITPQNIEEESTEMMDMDALDSGEKPVDPVNAEELPTDDGEGAVENPFSPVDDEKEDDLFHEEANDDNSFDSDELDDGFEENSSGESDDYGLTDYDDEDVGEKTIVFKTFAKFDLELFGEFAPYDRYGIDLPEIKIGRDTDKCQIVLNDPEVSSVHAVIKKNNILCMLEDIQSANGTIHNGSRISSVELINGDEFIIGSTTFTVSVVSDLIDQEKDRLMPVEENQIVEVEEIHEVSTDFSDDEDDLFGDEKEGGDFGETVPDAPKSLLGKFKLAWKDPKKRIRIIIAGVIILGGYMYLDDLSTTETNTTVSNQKAKSKVDDQGRAKVSTKKGKVLTPGQKEFVSSRYLLAKQHMDSGNYNEAIMEFESVMTVHSEYKQTQQLYQLAKNGRVSLEKAEQNRVKKLQEAERKRKINKLISMATKSVNEHSVSQSEQYFSEIALLDPDNFEVEQLKSRLKAWQSEQDRIAVEKAQKEAERKRKVEQLKPSKTLYIKKDWFNAIVQLERFMKFKNMDEDLTKEASKMLHISKENLNSVVGPLIGKARSLKEGQDLKGAYEHYAKALKYDPINPEALNEMNTIRETLYVRAKRVYREAIISESLSLFKSAQEKFQEVQQVSPTDSEYYRKATNKLKDYME